MENLSNQTTATESPDINTLEVEGRKLQVIWNKRQAVWTKDFKADTQSDGFDTRLGKLIRELKLESDSRQIASSRLRDCSLHSIDKRRRSEALWFVENEKECRSFMQTSKKGFTSLSALQRAMKQAAKANTPSSEEDTPEEVAETNPNVGANRKKHYEINRFN